MMVRIDRAAARALGAGAALGLALLAAMPARAADITLPESGSSLLYPLFNLWADAYAHSHPGVKITTASVGSGAGLQQAFSGQALIGASDAYMSDAEIRQNPQMVDIPLAISALTVNYNLPGLNAGTLHLDGPTIAGIYAGTIRQWDAPAIAGLNPGQALPHQPIIPVHRAEGSGDTFVFSQFLSFSAANWQSDTGVGTTIMWPNVPGAVAATGNAGMIQALQATPYTIGYVGVSYMADIAAGKIGTALLKNADGAYVPPTPQTILAGATSLGVRTPPDERLSLVFAPGAQSYPLVNYEYAVVSTQQANPDLAAALRRFLLWTIEPSETKAALLDQVHFVPLPPHIWELSQAQIQSIR